LCSSLPEAIRAGCVTEVLCPDLGGRKEREVTEEISGESCEQLFFLARRKEMDIKGGWGEVW